MKLILAFAILCRVRAAGVPSTDCADTLRDLSGKLKTFADSCNRTWFLQPMPELTLPAFDQKGSDCADIQQSMVQEIWKHATAPNEPKWRQHAISQAKSFLVRMFPNVGIPELKDGEIFRHSFCKWKNPTEVNSVSKASLTASLIKYLSQAQKCYTNEKWKEHSGGSIPECGGNFAIYVSERLKSRGSGIKTEEKFKSLLEGESGTLMRTQGNKAATSLQSGWIEQCKWPFKFYELRKDKFLLIESALKTIADPVDRANAALAILQEMPALYEGVNSYSDYVDILKKLDAHSEAFSPEPCTLDITNQAGNLEEVKSTTILLFLVRLLEGVILCGGHTLADLRVDGSKSSAADAEISDPKNDATVVKQVSELIAGFTKNVHDYSNELTLVGIQAAEAATRVQVHASLAELVLVVLLHRERIREMQTGVAGQITTVLEEIGDLLQIQALRS